MGDIRARVENVIGAQSGCAGDTLDQYDLWDWLQLASDLEEEFGLPISDERLETLKCVDEIESYIQSQIVKAS